MIYLSGAIRPELVGLRPDLGVMMQPGMGNKPDFRKTKRGCDNGCFAKPEKFVLDEYLAWLARDADTADQCLFATAPDVVGDAVATWQRSAPVFQQIRELGYQAALVAQDGIEHTQIEWEAFDVLFLGGTTAWKLSHAAKDLTAEAKRRGKWVHMGRVNSLVRLRTAGMWGCDSADGTFLAFGPDKNIPRLMAWLDQMRREPVLNFGAAA
ncbi:hypothetical protein [Azospirillum sp. TSO5]|uniref:hypothetical protein n=1 Tax=Azospirillum sp. TSO5 TaxID=716760 RepID=UPI000D611FD1|nr:hypothetical protein [Azospirillum sp. TSO5]PWC96936.1 hypothetical protein TSO5_05760 [Azospirillum sp. TSO5]